MKKVVQQLRLEAGLNRVKVSGAGGRGGGEGGAAAGGTRWPSGPGRAGLASGSLFPSGDARSAAASCERPTVEK